MCCLEKLKNIKSFLRVVLLLTLITTTSIFASETEEAIPEGLLKVKLEHERMQYHQAFDGDRHTKPLHQVLIRSQHLRKQFQGSFERIDDITTLRINYGLSKKWFLEASIPSIVYQQNSSLEIVKNTNLSSQDKQHLSTIIDNLKSKETSGLGAIQLKITQLITQTDFFYFRWAVQMEAPDNREPIGIMPIESNHEFRGLGTLLHWSWFPLIDGVRHNVKFLASQDWTKQGQTLEGAKGTYKQGLYLGFKYESSVQFSNFYAGIGSHYWKRGSTKIAEEDQGDPAFLWNIKAKIGWGNLSDLEEGHTSFPFLLRLGSSYPLRGRNAPFSQTIDVDFLFYF